MEIFLNLAWALLAAISVGMWAHVEHRTGAERRLPIIALVILIFILFPVISVSDDLWSMQSPAETDTCQRRDHSASCTHCLLPAMSALPEPFFVRANFGFQHLILPANLPLTAVLRPALHTIWNRPPPMA